jgi:hypothetical protein
MNPHPDRGKGRIGGPDFFQYSKGCPYSLPGGIFLGGRKTEVRKPCRSMKRSDPAAILHGKVRKQLPAFANLQKQILKVLAIFRFHLKTQDGCLTGLGSLDGRGIGRNHRRRSGKETLEVKNPAPYPLPDFPDPCFISRQMGKRCAFQKISTIFGKARGDSLMASVAGGRFVKGVTLPERLVLHQSREVDRIGIPSGQLPPDTKPVAINHTQSLEALFQDINCAVEVLSSRSLIHFRPEQTNQVGSLVTPALDRQIQEKGGRLVEQRPCQGSSPKEQFWRTQYPNIKLSLFLANPPHRGHLSLL